MLSLGETALGCIGVGFDPCVQGREKSPASSEDLVGQEGDPAVRDRLWTDVEERLECLGLAARAHAIGEDREGKAGGPANAMEAMYEDGRSRVFTGKSEALDDIVGRREPDVGVRCRLRVDILEAEDEMRRSWESRKAEFIARLGLRIFDRDHNPELALVALSLGQRGDGEPARSGDVERGLAGHDQTIEKSAWRTPAAVAAVVKAV